MLSRSISSVASRVVAALLLAAAQAALALLDARFDAALAAFSQARSGDASAIDKAADSFTALLKAEPVNPVLMAYAGAATAMRANTTWFPWKKMGFAEDGMALLDKSLAMLTAALLYKGDRVQVQGGLRQFGGPAQSVLAQLPSRRAAYLALIWAF